MNTVQVPTGKTCSACSGKIVEEFRLEYEQVDFSRVRIGGHNYRSFDLVSKFYCEDCGMSFNPTAKNGLKTSLYSKNIQEALCNMPEPNTLLRDLSEEEILFSDYPIKCSFKKKDKVYVFREKTMSEELGHFPSASEQLAIDKKEVFLIPSSDKDKLFDVDSVWWDEFNKLEEETYKTAMKMIKDGESFAKANKYFKSIIKGSEIHQDRFGIRSLHQKDKRPISYSRTVLHEPCIPRPKPPFGAVLAVKIIVLDSKFKQHYCWIPKDAVSKK